MFSTKDALYAFGETDDDGKRNVESFAAQHQSIINFMPVEGRVNVRFTPKRGHQFSEVGMSALCQKRISRLLDHLIGCGEN